MSEPVSVTEWSQVIEICSILLFDSKLVSAT